MTERSPGGLGVLAPAAQVGRYFAVVGGVSTLVAAIVPIVLLAAGAPSREPSLILAAERLRALNLADVGLLAVLVLAGGLVLHPLQFPFTQLLEGYWGTNSFAQRAMRRSIHRHYLKRLAVTDLYTGAAAQTKLLADQLSQLHDERPVGVLGSKSPPLTERDRLLIDRIPHLATMQEAKRVLSRYPDSANELMPTRLGNVLRRHERMAGDPYGLDAVVVVPYLAQVVDETLREYHDDVRSSFDLAVRMVLVWTSATVIGVALLWQYSIWLAVPLATFVLAYASYRGAVAAAVQYGDALAVIVALGRADLYRRLRVPFPADSDTERERNANLVLQLQGVPASAEYLPEPPPAPTTSVSRAWRSVKGRLFDRH